MDEPEGAKSAAAAAAAAAAAKHQCGVCVGDARKVLTCPGCAFSSCHPCQKRYGRPSCMQCRELFPRRFARDNLGATYVRSVLDRELHAQTIEAERQALPSAQPHVDWELEKRRILSRRRFGDLTPLPTKPLVVGSNVVGGFACPVLECRGFVYWVEGVPHCGTCKVRVCGSCREVDDSSGSSGHACDVRTLETLALLARDTKACPACKTPIHKTEGCDHMKCTYCGVHFSYRTLRVMATSTNHHYNDAGPIRDAGRGGAAAAAAAATECTDDGQLDDGIPRDVFAGPPALVRTLYEDRDCVRYLCETMFDEDKIVAKANVTLHELRVRYLLNELPEKGWIAKIVAAKMTREGSLARAFLLRTVLGELKSLQRAAHHRTLTSVQIVAQLETTYEMVDSNFQEVHDTYGGTVVRMRSKTDPVDAPPVRI